MSTRRALFLGLLASSGCASPAPPEAAPPRAAEAPAAPAEPALSASASSAPAEHRIVVKRRVPEGDVLALAMGSSSCALIRDKGVHCWGFVPLGAMIQAFQTTPVHMPGIEHAVATQIPRGSINRQHLNTPEAFWLHEDGRLRFLGVEPSKLLDGLGEIVQLDERHALDATGAVHSLMNGITPPVVSGPARRLSTAESSGCVVLESGGVECWGFNGWGTLDKAAPVRGVEDAVDVAAGREHACALRKDGAVLCWGSGFQGNLGDGNTARGPRGPVRVSGIDDAEQIATSPLSWTTCAIRKGGRLSCWGSSGEWFDKAKIEAGPVDVVERDVTLVTASRALCYATKAGEVRCAGFSHIVNKKGAPVLGGDDRKDAFYGKKPTDFRTMLRASDVKAR
ncbi:BNR repeat domain protein [Minicystis rosea]|nr:BNR repeat domain protein [Minicystis rosea]